MKKYFNDPRPTKVRHLVTCYESKTKLKKGNSDLYGLSYFAYPMMNPSTCI